MAERLAVVVVCDDCGRGLLRTLGSLKAQTVQPSCVLLEDRSTDLYTRELVAQLRGDLPARGALDSYRPSDGGSSPYMAIVSGGSVLDPRFLEAALTRLDADAGVGAVFSTAAELVADDPSAPMAAADLLVTGIVPAVQVFRPALWEHVADALRGRATLEFWIGFLQRGGQAITVGGLDSEVVGSRSAVPLADLEQLYRRHLGLIEQSGQDVLRRKRRRAVALAEANRRSREAIAALQDRFNAAGETIDELERQHRARGRSRVDWGELRRLTPVSPFWGGDRGRPINRYYIERFVERHRHDIRGAVLEVKDRLYTDRFGTGVTRCDVVDVDQANQLATITADLRSAAAIASDTYDCVILTQVLNVIDDIHAVLSHTIRMLRPGGVLLCTVAAVDRVSYEDEALEGDYWRFTAASLRACLAHVVAPEQTTVVSFGNVLTCAAHLYGLAAHELEGHELDHHDPFFPLIVAARGRRC